MAISLKDQTGYLIVYAVVLMFGLMTIGVVVLSIVGASYTFTRDDIHRKNAANMARACAKIVEEELNADANFTGFSPSAKTLYDRTNQNGTRSTCVVNSVTNGSGSQKIVQLTAYEYRSSSDTNPVSFKAQTVVDKVVGGGSGGGDAAIDPLRGGIFVGHGGFGVAALSNVSTSRMNVLGRINTGQLGSLTMRNNGPLNVWNIGCGDASNWPQPCSGNPISATQFSGIYGDICAPGQTNSSKLYYLNTNCQLPDVTWPVFDKAEFISNLDGPTIQASDILSQDIGCYYFQGGRYRGKTYYVPAGATIVGTLDFEQMPELYLFANTCTIEFMGDAYITGGINYVGDAEKVVVMKPYSGVEGNVTVVMNRQLRADRPNYLSFVPNASGNIIHLINFNSSNPTCSDSTTVPSSTVSTCLSNAQAMESATNDAYAALTTDITSILNVNWSGMTFFGYYARAYFDCALMRYDIGGLIVQGLGGCNSLGGITVTEDNPNFGIPIPESTGYKVIDFVQI
jgi:hypothetical protein